MYKKFLENIEEYCRKNVGEKVLFTVFMSKWPKDDKIDHKNLAILTSKALNYFENKGIVKEIRKSEEFYNPYPMYEIQTS